MTTPAPATCEWKNLMTGQPLCTKPARYRAKYEDCDGCPNPACCTGGLLCDDHAVTERVRADVVGLIELRLLPGVPA